MASRRATHAGNWYLGSKHRLDAQMEQLLENVPSSAPGYDSLPVKVMLVIHLLDKHWLKPTKHGISPRCPSHHVYFKGAQLTPFSTYETPLGDVPVDTQVSNELLKSGLFDKMSMNTDENEHSFEMHMPFIYKMTASSEEGVRPIVPILIGHTNRAYEAKLAKLLAPYFEDEENAFAISTDFCHWGSRFDYTLYTTDDKASKTMKLSRTSTPDPSVPIYKSIEILDRLGMEAASTGSYDEFNEYLDETDNTICGRRPLAILLKTVELANKSDTCRLKWIGYAQSSQVISPIDSSVSYASGFAVA